MRPHPKPWQSPYGTKPDLRYVPERADRKFHRDLGLPNLVVPESQWQESRTFPIDGTTVVIQEKFSYEDLVAMLAEQKLRRVNSGWHKAGYAIRFRTKDHASAFRLLWPGKTTVLSQIAAR